MSVSVSIDEISDLVNRYTSWLRDNTKLREVNGLVEITTPFLDRHNDFLQIFVRRVNGGFELTDDGYTIGDLEMSGCSIDSPRRKALLNLTLAGFGVGLDSMSGELKLRTSSESFAPKKHSLVQAMLAVNDLFYTARPVVASLFLEDVEKWLELKDIRYSPRVKFTGKTGYDHLFDFLIPRSSAEPERVLKAINHPSRESASTLVLAWVDTKEVRPPHARAYAVLNDTEQKVPADVLDALQSYDVQAVAWSARDQALHELAA